jgi:pyridoxine 4-dehydrogenase
MMDRNSRFLLAVVLCTCTHAFVVVPTTPWKSSYLQLSSKNEGDELSKLIGKREQIKLDKMKKREEAAESIEPTVDLDLTQLPEYLSKLPEFKNPRASRDRSTSSSKKQDEEDGDTKKKDVPIVDFMAEYEDENDFHIPNRIGITTSAWGDTSKNFRAKGKLTKRMVKAGVFVPGDIQLAYDELLQGGVPLVETCSSYGKASQASRLSAEHILGRCLKERPDELPESMIIETFASNPWFALLKNKGSLSNAMVNDLEASLTLLNDASVVEVYQAKKPWWFPTRFFAAGLAACVESGQCNRVGVIGITKPRALKKLSTLLEDTYDVPLTTASFDYATTNTRNEAMLDACKEQNVIPLCTDPFDGDLASGVYTVTNPSGGGAVPGRKFTFKELEKLQPLHSVQETIAERVRTRVKRGMRDTQARFQPKYGPPPVINTDITTTQVALSYIVAKGGVPMVQVNSPPQAKEVLGCLGWTLNEDDVNMLEQAAALCKL